MAVSQQQRQKQLFAAEDWQVIYTAFTQVNFNAYDFPTIRNAMVEYIRLNYPEDFNDWTESSEFVAIIDLLAYLGQSLAFRMDLNTRENFLDTAQRRESIFRLARMLNYQPQRAIPSTGLLKINQILTSEEVYDSNGVNLRNTPINWNDQNNPDWQEQFTLVLNAVLNPTNYIGNPVKSGEVNGIMTELYALNNTSIPASVLPFTSSVAGTSMSFEVCNPDFYEASQPTSSTLGSTGYFYERPPNPLNSWFFIYRNDGNGNGSPNTGYFLFFKQGTIGYADYLLELPIANRVIDVNASGVNQTDVWVQNINTAGLVTQEWTQVPSVNGFNVIYNSVDRDIRYIYQTITRDSDGDDQISIRFADGNFGTVPTGIIRVWYRVSNGLQYQIRPTDMSNLKFNFSYTDNLNNQYSLAVNSGLQYTVANSQAAQTNAQIALNAEQVFYTQDRMVNGEDYNLFPLQSSQALKVKAVNRTYSGQSRYIDINDPTGAYQNLNVFGTDGILYEEYELNRQEVSINPGMPNKMIVMDNIQPMIDGGPNFDDIAIELSNFYYKNFPTYSPSYGLYWKRQTAGTGNSTGSFMISNIPQRLGATGANGQLYMTPGSLVKLVDSAGKPSWTSIMRVIGDGTGLNNTGVLATGLGAVTLSTVPEDGAYVESNGVYAAFETTFTSDEIDAIAAIMGTKQTFGIGYNQTTQGWYVIDSSNLNMTGSFSLTYAMDDSNTNRDNSWLIKVSYNNTSWVIQSRAERYVFESVDETRFYFANTNKVLDPITGKPKYDYVSVLASNTAPLPPSPAPALGQDYLWQIYGQTVYPDGYSEPASVRVTFLRDEQTGLPVNPEQFNIIVKPDTTPPQKYVFWVRYTSSEGYQYYQPVDISQDRIYATQSALNSATGWIEGELAFVISGSLFFRYTNGSLVDVTTEYKVRVGRNDIDFLWRHYATYDQRINPAIMNIIDIYVLTATYDANLRNWISIGGGESSKPLPPTTEDLKGLFSYFEQFKMMTDQIIWNPVKYVILFGAQAQPEYQATFKVVKVPGTAYSDNEVKSLIKEQIDAYFALPNWDFGQNFFFTEMATFIQMKLATIVASIVLIPTSGQSRFGNLFEIMADSDEIFISSATVQNIVIVQSLTETQLGLNNG